MKRTIPSLDGLRAVSVVFVLIGHLFGGAFSYKSPAVRSVLLLVGNGNLGVNIFFGISGFLITRLLVKECARTGRIDLFGFYARRAFRIFPAFYFYLASILLLSAAGIFTFYPVTWFSAALYLRNYYPPFEGSGDWLTAHAWSLAVEEQFYLLWPPCFAVLGQRRSAWFAASLVAISPSLRVLNYLFLPGLRTDVNYMTHTRLDALMVGCLVAILLDNPRFKQILAHGFNLRLPLVAMLFLFFISPILHYEFQGTYQLLIGYSLEAFAVMLIVLWSVENPQTAIGRLLNSKAISHIGTISYSTYLWQQLFTHYSWWLAVPATLLAAEFSFHAVERPFLKFRDHVLRSKTKSASSLVTIGSDSKSGSENGKV